MAPASSRPGPAPCGLRRAIVALGSNMRHGRHGAPRRVLEAAIAALSGGGLGIVAVAPVRETAPIGPSRRRFANSAVLGLWSGSAESLLSLCHAVERGFGRRRRIRWGPRVLDCDLLLVEEEVALPCGKVRGGLVLPHGELARRPFVLGPLCDLWPGWRHPLEGLCARHLLARLAKPRPGAPAAGARARLHATRARAARATAGAVAARRSVRSGRPPAAFAGHARDGPRG